MNAPASAASGWSTKDRALALVVPLLLVVVATIQIVRVHTLDQSSWSGVGFGMFATVDGESTRMVRGFVLDGGAETEVALPEELERAALELAVVPTASRADHLAQRWAASIDLADGEGFAVEVRRVVFDAGGPSVHTERIIRVEASP